eukprot:6136469-Pleurochrysis_carterae.AAC.1
MPDISKNPRNGCLRTPELHPRKRSYYHTICCAGCEEYHAAMLLAPCMHPVTPREGAVARHGPRQTAARARST